MSEKANGSVDNRNGNGRRNVTSAPIVSNKEAAGWLLASCCLLLALAMLLVAPAALGIVELILPLLLVFAGVRGVLQVRAARAAAKAGPKRRPASKLERVPFIDSTSTTPNFVNPAM